MARAGDKAERRAAMCMVLRKVAGDLSVRVPAPPDEGEDDPEALRRRVLAACHAKAARLGFAHLIAPEPKLDEAFGARWDHVRAALLALGRRDTPEGDLEALAEARLLDADPGLAPARLSAAQGFRRLCADYHAPVRI